MRIHIKRSFDASKNTYDSSCDIQRLVADHLISKVEGEHKSILEIGTGTGIYTDLLRDRYPYAQVTCVDIAHSLLKGAMDKHPENNYICADGECLPISSQFDLITGSSALQWFLNPSVSIPEMLKLLKPGGEFAFSIFAKGTFTEMSILEGMTGFGSVYDLRSGDEYRGIVDADYEEKDYVLWFSSAKEFLKKQKGTGATFTGASKFTSKSSYQKFIELYPELFGENGRIPVTYNIFYMYGRKSDGS